ncbi:Ceramide glucosyltransferase [Acidisarcina polymorpha]|uniref:Ceramide glucosyltransferase n=1 Tax=Acidisarcina polymorpha TaxID=2211140 RepID=A0A2Z5FUW6_9BACT|nr:bacteriohopanetetrol glucosamine biosynthesis glycosyltransferase HpnI [Acidisarcina polymorpha]AXC10542.1 Ceramide glucosyltransferase [Acidisarcina polymorpha]
MPALSTLVSFLTTLLAFAGCGFSVLAIWSARAFVRAARKPLPDFYPPVSILKPVKGLDPEMYASFASHCHQNYPGQYELLFAIGSSDDPAIAAVEQLQRDFPDRSIRLVFCPETLGTNGKVSSLVQTLPEARFGHILISDSDILVSPNYLRNIMANFKDPSQNGRPVGMVTALYRGKAHRTLGSRMEALGIATDFAPNVLTARYLEKGIRFGLGSTLAVSREALNAVGGLLPLADCVADDYQLGARIATQGFEIKLSRETVETSVPAYRFREFWAHQMRWSRTVRDARPGGYFGTVFTFGLAWAILNVATSGASVESFALLSIALAARVSVALLIGGELLQDRQVVRDLWLLPARDLVALAVWAWSYAGNTVEWRGQEFVIRGGKMTRVMTDVDSFPGESSRPSARVKAE